MANLFKAFIFKLRKDLTFRITLIVGAALAVGLSLILFFIDLGLKNSGIDDFKLCTGQTLFVMSLSPAQNFGLAVPINLITFTVLEFTQGTIRNKIITGNSKTKIYFSLILSGVIFTLLLMISYIGLCVGLGSIFGGFDPKGMVMGTVNGYVTPEFLWKVGVLALLAYILIAVMTIFFASLIRSVGPCIPIMIILIMMFYFGGTIVSLMDALGEILGDGMKNFFKVIKIIDPLYSLAAFSSVTDTNTGVTSLAITNTDFWTEVINNAIYIGLFTVGGWLLFRKRDVK